MPTLSQEIPSPIFEHEDIVRKAFRLVAPDQEKILDALKQFGDLRSEVFVRTEGYWREMARAFRDVQEECVNAPKTIGDRWTGPAFDAFADFVSTGEHSVGKAAKKLADKAAAIADGLHGTNELLRFTWKVIGDSSVTVVAALVGGAAGAVLGSAAPVIGTAVLGAIGAAVSAIVTIIFQALADAIEAQRKLNTAVEEFIDLVPTGIRLPTDDISARGFDRKTVQVIDR